MPGCRFVKDNAQRVNVRTDSCRVTRQYLPEPAQYMIRYHSCYPVHREGGYAFLLDDHDREMLEWVRKFNPYDLYSKSDSRPELSRLRPYYEELVSEFFPAEICW